MKEVTPAIHQTFPAIKIYREELKLIFQTLRDEISAQITIEHEGYRYSPEEFLQEELTKVDNIVIIGRSERVSFFIHFFIGEVNMYVSSENALAQGVFTKIGRIIGKNRPTLYRLNSTIWIISSMLLQSLIVGLPFIVFLAMAPPLSSQGQILIVSFFFTLNTVLIPLGRHQKRNSISTIARSKDLNFWQRYRGVIIAELFVGVALLIIGALLD